MGIAHVVVSHLPLASCLYLIFYEPLLLVSRDSVATFYIALLLLCFTISNKATRISVAAMSIMVVVLVIWSLRALESKLAGEVFHNNFAVLQRSYHRFLAYLNRLHRAHAPVSRGRIQMTVQHSGV